MRQVIILLLILIFTSFEPIKGQEVGFNNSWPNKKIYSLNLKSLEDKYRFSGLLHYGTYNDSLLNNFFLGLNVNHLIHHSYYPAFILSPVLFFQNNSFKIIIENNLVNERFGFEFLSTKFSRAGFAFDYNVASLQYVNKKNNILISIGRSPIWWGQTFESTLIVNPFSGPYDNIYFNHELNEFLKLEAFTANLNSKKYFNSYINRFMAGHKVSYINKNKNFLFNLGEIFIYTGEDKSLDIKYLNPIIPYFLIDINDFDIEDDNFNSILFFDFRYNYYENKSIFLEIILDDYQIDDTGIENAIGFKLGFDYYLQVFEILNLSFENYLSENIYSHSGAHSYFLNNERPIGYQYGQACDTYDLDFNLKINQFITIKNSFLIINRTKPSSISIWDDSINVVSHNEFENLDFKKNTQYYDLSLHFEFKQIFIALGLSNEPIVDFMIYDNLHSEDKKLYLELNYFFDFSSKF